jgi:drug/metabolite transporter (DMT)-like permease
LAGAFVNLEPVVGAAAGWLALGEPASFIQLAGIVTVLCGIAMSMVPPDTMERAEPARADLALRLRRRAYEVLSFRA